MDGAVERTDGELRPHQVQGAAQRPERCDRQAMLRRLDALPVARTAVQGRRPKGSANHAYYIWVDVHNTLGLGNNVPIAIANGGESLLALVDGKFVDIRIPYPLGFFAKNADGRIDDAKAGWKGRGLWTTIGTRAYFHSEGGKDVQAQVFKVQMRPDPLAH